MSKLSDMEKMGNRRRFLTAFGATSLAALAGCLGDDDDDADDTDDGVDDGGEDVNGEDDNGDDDNGEDEIEGLFQGEVVIEDIFDAGFINELFRDGGITLGDGEEYDGRIVGAEAEGDVVDIDLRVPELFDEQGLTDADILARQIWNGFMSEDPEDIEDFSYETFEIEGESVDGEDAGSAFVQTEWIVEFFETDDIEQLVNTIEDENR